MEFLTALVNTLEPWHWAAVGLALLVGEISTGTTFLLWPAVAAGVTALVAWRFDVGGGAQVGLFAALTLALTAIGARYVRGRWLAPATANVHLNERAAQLQGARGAATVAFVNGMGRVRLGDTEWRAESADAIGAGESVEVVSADGPTLVVKKAS
ncbi:MAG: NfeD family protein [Hyphomonadaceae bacterium]|nr:NfeD family protein [Hyphomonadaceae bacterium]